MLKAQEKAENAFLRIAVSGGGCSGFQYGLSFDDRRNEDDFVFERDGVAVIVDEVSLGLLNGAEVDFVEEPMGASFQIHNPNAASPAVAAIPFRSADRPSIPAMKIASWNVNSVKARLPHLLAFLQDAQPDVLCLQETKCLATDFPTLKVKALGYDVETIGQRAYNGVALLSKRRRRNRTGDRLARQ